MPYTYVKRGGLFKHARHSMKNIIYNAYTYIYIIYDKYLTFNIL